VQNAQLPPPVDPSTQFDVLLRPGLLADVEIILENFPNAIHVPNQAVFERDGKPIVFVRKGDTWEERATAKRGEKKQEKGGGGPVGNLPAGGGRSRT
jgi:hypothetical protein